MLATANERSLDLKNLNIKKKLMEGMMNRDGPLYYRG